MRFYSEDIERFHTFLRPYTTAPFCEIKKEIANAFSKWVKTKAKSVFFNVMLTLIKTKFCRRNFYLRKENVKQSCKS